MKTYKTVITHRKEITQNTLEVTFRRPPGFEFKAGQHLQIYIASMPIKDYAGSSRTFSIVSSPADTQKLSIAFRRSGSGFKRSIESLPLGADIIIQDPYGHIALDAGPRRPLVCLAGGIGITPCLSMLRYAQANKYTTPITLVYANTSRQTAPYLLELEKMSKRNEWFTLHAVSAATADQTVHEVIEQNRESTFVVAGPPGMVEHMRTVLHRSGVDDDQIYYEEFVGY